MAIMQSGRAGMGVQYVEGTPPQTPILRPLRQSFYDSEIYPAAGARERNVFVNNTTFANGTPKTEADTNMTQGGRIGTPLEFDLVGLTMEYERGIDVPDHISLYNDGVFFFIFGQNVVYLQTKDTKIPQGAGAYAALDGNAAPVALVSNSWPSPQLFYNFTTADRKARRIGSNESFRVRKLWPAAPLVSRDLRFTIYMLGLLYGQI